MKRAIWLSLCLAAAPAALLRAEPGDGGRESVQHTEAGKTETRARALAARKGPILPLIGTKPDAGHALLERHVCIDTTASGGNARLTAVGDISFGAAAAWGLLWLWFWSPLSPVIWVGTATDFFDRVRSLFDRTGDHGGELATLLMIIVVWAFVGEVWRILRGVGRMIVGRC